MFSIFHIFGWWLAVPEGQPPLLEEALCSKRHSLSSHGNGQIGLFAGTEFVRRNIPDGSESNHRVGFVSVCHWIRKRETYGVVSVGVAGRRYGKGGSFSKYNT